MHLPTGETRWALSSEDLSALLLLRAWVRILNPGTGKASSSSAVVVVAGAVALFSIAAAKHLTFTLME